MEDLFHLTMSPREINQISVLGLAHCGDAVFELMVRSWLCLSGRARVENLHRATVSYVCAPAQAARADRMLPLLSEAELCDKFEISRNTVRQAIGSLEEAGFVVRKRGKGTFVADPSTRRKGVQYSFTTEISSMGKHPSSTLVSFDIIDPAPKIKRLMALEDGVKVYCFTRVRNVDNEPLILETSYYPQHIYPNLTREMLETHSFYSLLYHVGVVPFAAEDSYEAVTLGEYEAKLLGCVPGAAAFHHQRRTTMENGLVYECTSSYMRGDRVRLDVCFQKSGTSFTRVVD